MISAAQKTPACQEPFGAENNWITPSPFLPEVLLYLIDKLQVSSALDIGAGTGRVTRWLVDQGVFTLGVESDTEALKNNLCPGNMYPHDYTQGPFTPCVHLDLGWFAGFNELPDDDLISNLSASFRVCKHVCLVQAEPLPFWIKRMRLAGFIHDVAETHILQSLPIAGETRGSRTLALFKRRLE